MMNKVFNVACQLALALSCLWMASCGSDEATEPAMEPITIPGDYTGVWNSRTETASFSNVLISARISETGTNQYSGPFFITPNFVSCCGGPGNDGTITFTVEEDSLLNFVYDDVIPNCEGTFTGKGIIHADGTLQLTIAGTDCDGTHAGGIFLNK